MTRYILIDDYSGYIWGDSADLDGRIFSTDDPVEYARALDASIGGEPRHYEMMSRRPDGASGYHVYRDASQSDAVPVVWDGQDQQTIDAVVESCEYDGFIVTTRIAD